jgi:hypothetical protein
MRQTPETANGCVLTELGEPNPTIAGNELRVGADPAGPWSRARWLFWSLCEEWPDRSGSADLGQAAMLVAPASARLPQVVRKATP